MAKSPYTQCELREMESKIPKRGTKEFKDALAASPYEQRVFLKSEDPNDRELSECSLALARDLRIDHLIATPAEVKAWKSRHLAEKPELNTPEYEIIHDVRGYRLERNAEYVATDAEVEDIQPLLRVKRNSFGMMTIEQ